MDHRRLVWPGLMFLSALLPGQNSSLKAQNETVITVNADKIVKPVAVKFGTGVGSLHRGPGWPPVDLSDQALIDLVNELKPGFINLQYTKSPGSVEHIIGLPFFPESTGEFSHRLSYIETIEEMGIDSSSAGPEGELYALFTSADTFPDAPAIIQGVAYYTYRELCRRPPHKNYDDLLQFFERLESPPEIFIRVPTIFMTYIDDPFPHRSRTRAEISVDLDPQTGAQLVHYLNDPPTTELGSLRAENGHPEPYNVKYFMLGNELWWPYVDSDLSLDRIVTQTVAFSTAMKAADHSIKIVFNPVDDAFPESFLRTGDPIVGPIIQKLRGFNPEVIARTKGHVDAVEFFRYGLAIGDGSFLPPLDREGWKSSIALSQIYDKYDNAGRHRGIADQYGAGVPMIMGEFGGPSARLGGAIYDADYMIYLLKSGYDVFVANWNLGLVETNYYGLISQEAANRRPPRRRPSFYVQKMFNNYFGNTIVESDITDPPLFDAESFDTGSFLRYPAVQDVPALNAIATTSDDALYLVVINRDLDKKLPTRVVLNDFVPTGGVRVYTLNGPSVDANNEENPQNVKIVESAFDATASFSYSFEKHSLTVMVLRGTLATVGQNENQAPDRFGLLQNYPNPFNPCTAISYSLPTTSSVSLQIFNSLGREVRALKNGTQPAGFHSVTWDGQDEDGRAVGPGIYFYRIRTSRGAQDVKRMILMK